MILVTVGTQKFQFDRLFKNLDELVAQGKIQDEIIAQIGYSKYNPQNFKSYDMIELNKMEAYIKQADLIITHGGTSSIILALKNRKKVVVVPRLKRFGEHVDNHQLEIANMYFKLGLIEVVEDINQLMAFIELAKTKQYNEFKLEQSDLIPSINSYLHLLEKEIIK